MALLPAHLGQKTQTFSWENPATVRGPLFERLNPNYAFGQFEKIQQTDEAELYILRYSLHKGSSDVGDSELKFVTKDSVLATLGLTGLVSVVEKVEKNGDLTEILRRDHKGNFNLERKNLPVDGVVDNEALTDEQLIPLIIDYVYNESRKLPDDKDNHLGSLFHYWTAERFISRFRDFQSLLSKKDIIPDHSDLTVPVKLSDGCPYSCIYCPEGNNFKPKSMEEIIESMKATRAIQEEYHRRAINQMDEGFLNTSDLLLFTHRRYKKYGVDPVEVVKLFKETFPEVEKLGTFFSVRSIIRMKEEHGEEYSKRFFKNLAGAGLNRAYIGIETANDEGSRLLGKKDRYADKLYAINLLQECRIYVKAILQVGVLGEGFYPLGKKKTPENFVKSEKAIEETIRLMNEAQPYRTMISEFVQFEGRKIFDYIANGQIVPYKDSREGIKKEIEMLDKGICLQSNGRIEPAYEKFLPTKPRH